MSPLPTRLKERRFIPTIFVRFRIGNFKKKIKIKHVKKCTGSTTNFSAIIFENAFAFVYEFTMSNFKVKKVLAGVRKSKNKKHFLENDKSVF